MIVQGETARTSILNVGSPPCALRLNAPGRHYDRSAGYRERGR